MINFDENTIEVRHIGKNVSDNRFYPPEKYPFSLTISLADDEQSHIRVKLLDYEDEQSPEERKNIRFDEIDEEDQTKRYGSPANCADIFDIYFKDKMTIRKFSNEILSGYKFHDRHKEKLHTHRDIISNFEKTNEIGGR